MAYVNPIANPQHQLLAEQHVKTNFDAAYHLIYRLGVETGFRITDLTEIRWENIDFSARTIKIAENKGSKARMARSRLKVLETVKGEMISKLSDNPSEMMKVYITKTKDIYSMLTGDVKANADLRIQAAIEATPPKFRTAKVSNSTIATLKARHDVFGAIDDGNVFSRKTLKSNRARNIDGVLSRQSCWKVLSTITGILTALGESVKIGAHSLRKIFARNLYFSSGKDIALLMRTIGHSSVEMSLRYIGITNEEEMSAMDKMFEYMAA